MKKVIFGIFAHPDDEAFGPGGTLILETSRNAELHLISLTAGDAGMNIDGHTDLADVRMNEWKEAAKLLGAHSTTLLGYKDGEMSNSSLVEIVEKLQELIKKRLKTLPSSTTIEIMSFELGGISGHIDHIIAARAATQVFYQLKSADERIERLRLFCLPDIWQPEPNIEWLLRDKGYSADAIGEIVDTSSVNEQHKRAIQAHVSQRRDGAMHIRRISEKSRQKDHFIVRE